MAPTLLGPAAEDSYRDRIVCARLCPPPPRRDAVAPAGPRGAGAGGGVGEVRTHARTHSRTAGPGAGRDPSGNSESRAARRPSPVARLRDARRPSRGPERGSARAGRGRFPGSTAPVSRARPPADSRRNCLGVLQSAGRAGSGRLTLGPGPSARGRGPSGRRRRGGGGRVGRGSDTDLEPGRTHARVVTGSLSSPVCSPLEP